jgi:hypothetical protein
MVQHVSRFHISVYHAPGQAVDDPAPRLQGYPSHVSYYHSLYWDTAHRSSL